MNQKLLINKKYFLVLIAGIFLFSCAGMNSTKDTRSINTSTGVIQGLIKNQVISWEDIPYAQPPVGDLRWRAPRAFEDQGRTILARDDNGCLQESSIYAGIQGEGIVGQEDCLYLDIQAPENSLNNSLPVMFWIHGGGNTSGI